jgi:hypothetical protein
VLQRATNKSIDTFTVNKSLFLLFTAQFVRQNFPTHPQSSAVHETQGGWQSNTYR